MRRAILLSALGLGAILLPSLSRAQLSIENPRNLSLPSQRAEVVYRVVCDVVANEFNTQNSKVHFPVTLVLGERDQRYTANDDQRIYKIYLREWDESYFTSSAMMLAIHGIVSREREQRMLMRILQRTNQIEPVQVTTLSQAR